MPDFKLGDYVKWTSQAAGVEKVKVGVVARIVSKGEPSHLRNSGMPRNHLSYVVLVKKTENSVGKAYWPRVSKLRPLGKSDEMRRKDIQQLRERISSCEREIAYHKESLKELGAE